MLITTETRFLNLMGFRPTGDFGPLTGYTTKRGKAVWFLKSPPTTPASPWQLRQRNAFRLAAIAWQTLTAAQRQAWLAAQDAGRLNITGYNLWVYYQLTKDVAAIRTIERQTGLQLLPA